MTNSVNRAERVRVLFSSFFKISAIAVGGGLTMLPLIEAEFVEKRKWIDHQEMVDCVAVVQSMPGIIGCNISVALGYRIAGIPGLLSATLGIVLPPFLAILVIGLSFLNLGGNTWIDHAFLSVRAAICALLLLAAVKMGKNILKTPFPIILAVISFCILTLMPKINAIWVILGAAAVGLIRYFITGGKK